MKSTLPDAFYVATGENDAHGEVFESTPSTAGPWTSQAQHGGPPAALLGRALERLEPDAGRVLGMFSMDLLGPVPVGPLAVSAQVDRPGRTVALRSARLYDVAGDRLVATARAWAFPDVAGPSTSGPMPSEGPESGVEHPRPEGWSGGYLDSVEWSWLSGAVTEPGPARVWMRPRLPLLAGEELTPAQRLLLCVDSASGVSAALDPRDWNFLNTELTVHIHRVSAEPWLLLEAATELGGGAVGTATSTVSDVHGPVGHSAQALLVVKRPGSA